MKLYKVTDIELYLSEVGDGDPECTLSEQEQFVLNQRCLGRWRAKDKDDLCDVIFEAFGYHVESIKWEEKADE